MPQLPLRRRVLVLGLALSVSSAFADAPKSSPSFDVNDIDPAIAPCADFNGHVNAKWVAANPIPPDRSRWGAFDELREKSLSTQRALAETAASGVNKSKDGSVERKIGAFYRSGMAVEAIEKAGLTPLRPELSKIAAIQSQDALVAYLRDSFSRGMNALFTIGPSADYKNAKMQIAYVGQGGLGLPTPDYYDSADYAAQRDAYREHVAKVLVLGGMDKPAADAAATRVLAFETRLAKASIKPVEMRKPENQYHFVSLAEADTITPKFSWAKFFAAQNTKVGKGFSLSQPTFFAEMDRMIADVPLAEWRDYLRFHAIDGASPYLSKAFADEHFAFYKKTLSGQKEQEPRWKLVLGAVNEGMGMGLGELYVAQAFPPEAKVRAKELVDNVQAALKARIEKLEWMGPETRKKALEKWATFLPKIGYPEKWRDWSGLAINPDDYFGNVAAATRYNYAWEMSKVGKPTDRKEWGMTPQTVNAYYNPTDNTINFPAAILQPPFFDAQADDALNYGGIGAVIGHEATHGYDDEGSQFDAAGNNRNWWTQADREQFEARAAKLVQQFNGYEPLPGKHVNGELTLGENIADLGGVSVAFDALQAALKQHLERKAAIDGYTPEQRFFLNFARIWRGSVRPERQAVMLASDPHAPARYRAIAAPSNLPQFAQAFSCKTGDAMVRDDDKRVVIW